MTSVSRHFWGDLSCLFLFVCCYYYNPLVHSLEISGHHSTVVVVVVAIFAFIECFRMISHTSKMGFAPIFSGLVN